MDVCGGLAVANASHSRGRRCSSLSNWDAFKSGCH